MLRPPGAPARAPSPAALIAEATVWAADGSTSVSSQTPWMAQAQRTVDLLVQAAREHGEHLLGICLGSQLIAHRAAPGSVIAGPGMQAGLAPLAWRDGRGPAVISARSMSARHGSATPGVPRPPCGMSWPACCRSWRFQRPSRRADPAAAGERQRQRSGSSGARAAAQPCGSRERRMRAAPSWYTLVVTSRAASTTSSGAWPMATPRAAHSSISMSLCPSPIATV